MKVKKNKLKTATRCYKKYASRSLSDCSLSQLLHVASLKKRINDLTKNNRLLTSALQESRMETAVQNNLLKNYAKDSNQILFARIKLNEMARNMAKFATDLEEVRSYLNDSLPSDYDFFQKNGFCKGRITKDPNVSCIEEESEVSRSSNVTACEDSANILQNNLEGDISSVNQDIEMNFISSIDDVEEIQKKGSYDKASVISELNVDLSYVNQKRSTRSRRNTPVLENECSPLGDLFTHLKEVSSPLIHQREQSVEIKKIKVLQTPSDEKRVGDKSEKLSILSFQNLPDGSLSRSPNICSNDQSPVVEANGKKSVVLSDPSSELNPIVILCDYKQLKEVLNSENNSLIINANNPEHNSEIHTSVLEENKDCIGSELFPESDLPKLLDNSQMTPSLLHDIQLPYDDEIQNVGSLTFCESDNDDDEKENTASPSAKTSRSRKPASYTDYFSSDDSDVNSPFKLASEKRNVNGRVKLNSTPNVKLDEKKSAGKDGDVPFDATNENPEMNNDDEKKSAVSPFVRTSRSRKPVNYTDYFSSDDSDVNSPSKNRNVNKRIKSNSTPNSKLDEEKAGDVFSDAANETSEMDYSVYNLDVSNSKRVRKKIKRKPSAKSNNIKSNGLPKPLFPKCSVTKLKAGNFKFSKCVSPGGILKKVHSRNSGACEDSRNQDENMDNTKKDKLQSVLRTPKSVLQTPKSESKRVSFAPTDVVCSFERMSVSKTIADNRKVRRTSKSIIDLKDLFEEKDKSKIFPASADNSPVKAVDQVLNNSVMFDFSADTEMYTLPNISYPSDDIASSKPPAPTIFEQMLIADIRNDNHLKKSPRKLSAHKNVKRLSLKQNKVIFNKTSQYTSEKAEMETKILLLESPVPLVKPPKRKSLFKEIPDDDLKDLNSPERKCSLINNMLETSSKDDLKERNNSDHLSPEKKVSINHEMFKELLNNSLNENFDSDHPSEKRDSIHSDEIFKRSHTDNLKKNINSEQAALIIRDSLKNKILNESLDDDLKENINSDHPSEKRDSMHSDEISKRSDIDDLKKNINSEDAALIIRDSLKNKIFNESLDDDLKENINSEHPSEKSDSIHSDEIFKRSDTDNLKKNISSEQAALIIKDSLKDKILNESLDDDLKENINSEQTAPEKKDSLKNRAHTTKNTQKKSSYSKCQSKVHSKISLNKKKKCKPDKKSLEHSLLLIDSTNLIASTTENLSRRRSKLISYKEPSLTKKMRRD